jgi:hypothetical protein
VRTVIGYHACPREYAEAICAGEVRITDWQLSANKYDWLGDGGYFWEDGLRRAREWARDFVKGPAGIVRAEIDLGRCLDLSETEYLDLIRTMYADVASTYRAQRWQLPVNRELGAPRGYRRRVLAILDRMNVWLYFKAAGVQFERKTENKLRFLDSFVLNQFLKAMESDVFGQAITYQTVRCPFEEGEPLFPGSMIRTQSHVQISVRDRQCIRNVSLIVDGD